MTEVVTTVEEFEAIYRQRNSNAILACKFLLDGDAEAARRFAEAADRYDHQLREILAKWAEQ